MKTRPFLSFVLALFSVSLVGSSTFASADRQSSRGLHIVVIEGEDSINVIQQKTAVAPVVEVRDRNDQPIAGATVRFAVKGGKAVLQNGLKEVAVTTDAAGRATIAVNPIANGAVEIETTASFGGQSASATISQTNVATAADAAKASAKMSSGGGHTGLIVTSAALAGGGIVGYQQYQKYKEEDEVLNASCAFQQNNSTVTVPAGGGAFNYGFQADCNWKATSDQPWLVLTGPTTGARFTTSPPSQTQPVNLPYSAQPNTGPSRTGHITIEAQERGLMMTPIVVTITQSAGQ
jgi:hypothetical protein